MQITLHKAKLRRVLLGVMGVVVAAGVAVEVLKPIYKLKSRRGIVPLLSLSYEGNVPTWYTSALLVACAFFLALIAAGTRARGERYVAHWWGLAAGFMYISLDEVVSLHEAAGFLELGGGVLYFSWVVPAAAVVLGVGLLYLKFLVHLPGPIRRQFILSGGIYVAGAVGMELPLGWWTDREGTNNLGYALIDSVEEAMEMLGLNLFLFALWEHLGAQGLRVAFAPAASGVAPEAAVERAGPEATVARVERVAREAAATAAERAPEP